MDEEEETETEKQNSSEILVERVAWTILAWQFT